MHTIREQKTLPYSLDFLYSIIMDITSYPQFLPWCKSIKIISTQNNEIVADVIIEYKGFSAKYTSLITCSKNDQTKIIAIQATGSGPFKFLKSTWKLQEIKQDAMQCDKQCATKISFNIEFQFNSILLEKFTAFLLFPAKGKIIQAFESRAKNLQDKDYS